MPPLLPLVCLLAVPAAPVAEPLHVRLDAIIDAAAKGRPISPPADDGEFLRRATLDLAGRIPTVAEARPGRSSPTGGRTNGRGRSTPCSPGRTTRPRWRTASTSC